MFKKPMFFFLVVLFIAIGLAHYLAIVNYWYWQYAWTDIVMHGVGGLFIGLLLLFVVFRSGYISWHITDRREVLLFVLLGTLIIGAMWEIMEVFLGVTFVHYQQYVHDTIFDFAMDTLGALAAYLMYAPVLIPKVRKQ